ncbi:helix-turn-helix domain-containing protein [Streptomyces sp. NPDC050504]|uniref:helix-turn-helix domain-containing protein n=1 Tax=Streptomyces sp. NPDC050504 TaxID=3365618 RepID=UPI00378DE051
MGATGTGSAPRPEGRPAPADTSTGPPADARARPSAAVRRLDAHSLRGLAHPLRMQLLDVLRVDGPSNSTRLAERVGESTGTVSWHLRRLAHHGFIEEDPGHTSRRERWWRAPSRTEVVDTAELGGDAASRAAVASCLEELLRWSFGRVSRYLREEWPRRWRAAATVSEWTELRLTPEQLADLTRELAEVVERRLPAPGAEPPPGALPVVVQLQAFPRTPGEAAE